MTTPNLQLHIEELVLHGFAMGDRHAISAALQQELTRLFTEQGIPPNLSQGGRVPQLNGGTVAIAPGTRPELVGSQIAQSLYNGITGTSDAASG